MLKQKPIEFEDCVIDGPKYRTGLQEHEKVISDANKYVKTITLNLKSVFDSMGALSNAMILLASSLRDYPLHDAFGRSSNDDVNETEDERIIKNSLNVYANLLETIENTRKDLVLGATQQLVMGEIQKLRSTWLSGTKNETKKFKDRTTKFCEKQDKFLSLKTKSNPDFSKEDEQMKVDRHDYVKNSIEYVQHLQQANEEKMNSFVSSISLLVQMFCTFQHQSWEHCLDAKRRLDQINESTQRAQQNYQLFREESDTLKDKVLMTPLEYAKPSGGDPSISREGYLFIQTKKAMATTSWVKYFCSYHKENKTLIACQFNQANSNRGNEEVYHLRSCVRRATDSIDRRFCFDIEVAERKEPLTLQALSNEDLHLWMTAMDGTEPIYAIPKEYKSDVSQTRLNESGIAFLKKCLSEIEKRGLREQGLYRLAASKVKLDKLIQISLESVQVIQLDVSNADEYDTKTLTSAVKHFIRHLPEPLMTYNLHDKFISAAKMKASARLKSVEELLCNLPPKNFEVLSMLIVHLDKVAQNCEENLMTAANLGVVFGPTLFRSQEASVAAIMDIKFAGVLVEIFIENAPHLFTSAYAVSSVNQTDNSSNRASISHHENSSTSTCNKPSASFHSSFNSGNRGHSSSDASIKRMSSWAPGQPVGAPPIVMRSTARSKVTESSNDSRNISVASRLKMFESTVIPSQENIKEEDCEDSSSSGPTSIELSSEQSSQPQESSARFNSVLKPPGNFLNPRSPKKFHLK